MTSNNTLTIEDDLKRKFRKLQKVIHKSLIEKDLTIKKNQIIDIIQSISETISHQTTPLYVKCSNCKVISDESQTFRSPFFGNDHFTMPIQSDDDNTSLKEQFSGILTHEYPTKSILYYFDKDLIQIFMMKIKTQLLDENNSDTLSSDLVLSLSILSVLLPSSFLSTDNIDNFYQKQQVFFTCTEESKTTDDE